MLNKKQIIVLFLLGIILIINNWSLPLWDQDEAAYAGFGKTMNETGNYLIPDYYFSDDHRKTPLHFWNIALSFKIFGANEFAVRLPSVLAILGTLFLVFFQTKNWLGIRTAYNSTVVLGTSLLVTSLAKISVTDATVLFFSTLAGFALINQLLSPKKKWTLYFWLGIAGGVMTKGPPILIFIAIFVFLLFIFHPKRFNLFKLHPWFFLPLALAPVFIWGYAINLKGEKEFLEWLIDWYILKRVNGSVYGQSAPFGTHLVLIFGFFSLYLMYAFNAFANVFKGFFSKDLDLIILGCWFISGWLLYEFTPSKLPAYVIVSHVGLAILIGKYINQLNILNKKPKILFVGVHYVINYALGVGLIIAKFFIDINGALSIALIIIGSLYVIVLTFQLINFSKREFTQFQFVTNALLIISLWSIAPLFSEHINSSQEVSEYVLSNVPEDTPIIIAYAPGKQPSLPFYLSEKGNPITVELSKTGLKKLLNESKTGAFIVEKSMKPIILKNDSTASFYSITSRLIDRKEQAEYYIYLKK